jgi:hypothetical protein
MVGRPSQEAADQLKETVAVHTGFRGRAGHADGDASSAIDQPTDTYIHG